MSWMLFVPFYSVAYMAFQAVWHWTGSLPASWAAAIVSIPVCLVLYVRLVEYLRRPSPSKGEGAPQKWSRP